MKFNIFLLKEIKLSAAKRQELHRKSSLFLVIEHTVAISLEVGICYLLAELTADTPVLLALRETAGAEAAPGLEPFFYAGYKLLILVQSYLSTHHTMRSSKYP